MKQGFAVAAFVAMLAAPALSWNSINPTCSAPCSAITTAIW